MQTYSKRALTLIAIVCAVALILAGGAVFAWGYFTDRGASIDATAYELICCPTPVPCECPGTLVPTVTAVPPTPTPFLTTPTITPTPAPVTGIENWTYQLSNYQNDSLAQIAASDFDLAVVDLARDGSGDYFTVAEVGAVKDTGKVILAYFEIGAIENYRPEWPDVPADLMLGPVGGWPSERYVKYWDQRWWDIVVKGRVDQAIAAGFDGAYLDMIVTYEEIPAGSAGTNRADLAQKMVNLIARVSQYAKAQRPGFLVFPQNSPELRTYSGYLTAIDGLGMEEMYFKATDDVCNESWCAENRANAAAVHAAGKMVLSIDYANNTANIASAYTQARGAGFVPYVSVVALDTMRINPGYEPGAPTPTPVPPATVTPPPPTVTPTPRPPTPTVPPVSGAYYVSPSGSDSNPGTEALPFRTITKGVSALVAGKTLLVRQGTYSEKFSITTSGTAANPVVIMAHPGEHPIIDGQGISSGYEGFHITISGNYVTLDGLEVQNVDGSAIWVRGNYDVVRNMRIHNAMNKGIFIGRGGYCPSDGTATNTGNIIEDNEIWLTSLIHEGVTDGGSWVGALTAARCPSYTTIRRNRVHENWGMGLQTHEAYSTTIQDNVTWNNQTSHIYVNNAPYSIVRRNLAYNTPDSVFLYQGRPGGGITFCDERAFPVTHHVTIVNNLTLGTDRGFYFWNQQASSGLKYFTIANNAFINNFTMPITIRAGVHEHTVIANNMFVEAQHYSSLALISTGAGLQFSHNLWSEAPPTVASGDGDVIGDPHLSQVGPTGAGQLMPEWFRPLPDSPAIDVGVVAPGVVDDFDLTARPVGGACDIGAYEQ